MQERVAHQFQAGEVVGGVAAVSTWGVVGRADAIATVPGAQGGGGDAELARYCGDAQLWIVNFARYAVVKGGSGVGW